MHTLDHLKKTADGRTILIPQPTDDPLQSLNWSGRKKHIVLFVLTYCTLMTDMSSAWSIPLVITQAEYWGISPSNAGRNLSGNIFMLGVGGIAAVPATRWLGRLPVLFWSMTIALFMSVFAVAAPGWISYIVARSLLGFFVTAPQVVGLSMLHDMFFFHGPFLSGIINNYCGWRVSTWVRVVMQDLGIILVVLLADETYYDSETSKRYTADIASGKSKWRIQCEKLVGVTGYQAHYKGVGKTMTALLIMVLRPHFVALCFFYLLTFAWSIGLNTTLTLFLAPPPPEGYGCSNADISPPLLTIAECDHTRWWTGIEVNLKGAYLFSHYVLPIMQKQGLGHIIITASRAAAMVAENITSYSVSKLAVTRLAECIHEENYNKGIKCFAIHPGGIITRLLTDIETKETEGWAKEAATIIRPMLTDDISLPGNSCVYLASGKADFLSGRYVDLTIGVDNIAKNKEAIIEHDLFKTGIALNWTPSGGGLSVI